MIPTTEQPLTALITGGAGFIGSHLAEVCRKKEMRVIILDNFSTGLDENITTITPPVTVHRADITDLAACTEIAQGVDIIFHLAAQSSVPESITDPYYSYEANVRGTYNLLEAARIQHVPYFIFSSSAAVYGAHEGLCDEDLTPCNPLSPYGSSKLIGEIFCRDYGKHYGLRSACLRYFNVYGARQRANLPQSGIVAKITHAMKYNMPITVYGDGLQERDFIPVETVVAANVRLAALLVQNAWHGETFNIASGNSITLRALIQKLHLQYPDYNLDQIAYTEARSGDIKFSAAHCKKYATHVLQT